ncbi:lectin C-type domain protein [Necator americanus]|uniref:Lectin C-type domain protein n=1 Tax=Necator americanus TaxID=51031 RepID=W2SUV7_NECAM|nr:lectin C-type domain protein [Necator americanus]ETN72487.1 lectin C-type domain protein [Necator americanus]
MILPLIYAASLTVTCFSEENDRVNATCPEYYSAFTKEEVTRCHNLTVGSYSYDEADRLCRVKGAELSTASNLEELQMLREQAQQLLIDGKVLLNRGTNSNDTCVIFEVNSTDSFMEVQCDSEEAQGVTAFSCMLPDRPTPCTTEDGGRSCKLTMCPKGHVGYYRKKGNLVCHKEAQGVTAFSCMLPDRPTPCTTEDGGRSCKLTMCPKGHVGYYRKKGNLVCHKIINKPAVWPEAEKMCEELGDSYKLASFEDGQEAGSVMEEARRMFQCHRENCYGTLWIGGKRQATSLFEWEFDGSLGEIGPYNNFDDGEPDGDRHNKTEDCLAIFIDAATYLDQHCTDDLSKLRESYYEIRGFVCTSRRDSHPSEE